MNDYEWYNDRKLRKYGESIRQYRKINDLKKIISIKRALNASEQRKQRSTITTNQLSRHDGPMHDKQWEIQHKSSTAAYRNV